MLYKHALDPFQGGTVRADIPFDYCTAGNEKLRDTDVCASIYPNTADIYTSDMTGALNNDAPALNNDAPTTGDNIYTTDVTDVCASMLYTNMLYTNNTHAIRDASIYDTDEKADN